MLDAGIVYCQNCGKAFDGFYYKNGTTGLTVLLKRSVTGKFFVQPEIEVGSPFLYRKAYLAQHIDRDSKVFHKRIKVGTIDKDSNQTVLDYDRICPGCSKILPNAELGTVPTYIIAVIGEKKIGKSCFIRSANYMANIVKINSEAQRKGSRYFLSAEADEGISTVKKTEINEFGETRILYIKEKRGKKSKTIAAVLFMDFAGELFTKEHLEQYISRTSFTAFTKNGDYKGVDAVVFMDAADRPNDSLVQVYNQVKDDRLLENKPVAYVLNKLDILVEHPPEVTLSNLNKKVPLISENTFRQTSEASVARDELIKRIELQTYITKKIKPLAQTIYMENPDSAGFIIKAGESSDQTIDLTKSINVTDPLLWLLNKLDIFPII